MSLDPQLLQQIIEGALLAAGQPMSRDKLLTLFDEDESQPDKAEIQAALEAIQADCEGRGFELVEVGSGWRFQVRRQTAPWVNRLWEEKPQKYSRALLETLALIAYRQPITRGDIEEIRGVAVSSHIIKTLTEREWVKVVGHRDVPGRPSLYATTRRFLDYFNLKSLDELPSLSELRDIDGLNNELDFDESDSAADTGAPAREASEQEASASVDTEAEPVAGAADSGDDDGSADSGEPSGTDSDEEGGEPAFAGEGMTDAELAQAPSMFVQDEDRDR